MSPTAQHRTDMSPVSSHSTQSSTSVTPTMSSIRRKPQITYQSPSATSPARLSIEGNMRTTPKLTPPKPAHVVSPPTITNVNVAPSPSKKLKSGSLARKMRPPLPLYHPLGRLAMSLPQFDPASLGIPVQLAIVDDHDHAGANTGRRSSSRTRRPVAKLRDAADDDASVISTSVSTVVVTKEKEKSSPRKKRAAGGAANKRKRKEPVDESDASYPAQKRNTRTLRGAASSPDETAVPEADVPVVQEEASAEEKTPRSERRARRPREVNMKRRGSSGSEATSVSVSMSVATAGASRKKRDNGTPHDGEKDVEMDVAETVGKSSGQNGKTDKEEGEVSES